MRRDLVRVVVTTVVTRAPIRMSAVDGDSALTQGVQREVRQARGVEKSHVHQMYEDESKSLWARFVGSSSSTF
ncbi:MAG: hypothetical protein DRO93_05145 [Candidatus Thorarchaeota archaeon]|nr:MAG: hypothetical protein DRO93_05145 [Candidatus Thorarchaeota archaeon]